jgi:hypothetical protein
MQAKVERGPWLVSQRLFRFLDSEGVAYEVALMLPSDVAEKRATP